MSKDLDPTGGAFSGRSIAFEIISFIWSNLGPKDTMVGKIKGSDKPESQT